MHGEGASIRFHCPACGRALTSPANAIGRRATCPLCHVSITIPALPASPCGDPAADETTTEIAAAAIPNGDPPDWRKLVQTHREFVPLIECPAGVGSGLLISGDGLVVTNRHVIDGARVFMLTFYDGSKAKAVTVHTHSHRDLAIVRAAIRPDKHFDIARAVADAPLAGD